MIKLFPRLTASLLAICAAASLPAGDGQPQFEVASVKPAAQCSPENTVDSGRIALHADPLNLVLMEAFKVNRDQIVGPSWLDTDCFVIDAKMPEGATKDQLPAMLQSLLAERFKLAVHRESRPRPGFALAIDKNGPKLKASDPNSSAATSGRVVFGSTLQSKGIKGSMTMASLARLLSLRVSAPVEDLTGLSGKFDVDVSWALDPAFERPDEYAIHNAEAHPDAELPPAPTADLFAAVRESLGLRLDARTEQVEVIVIDHVERIPTEN